MSNPQEVCTRQSWDAYFMDLANMAGTRSTCIRHSIGAIIVKNRRVISTGYNGAPKNLRHCIENRCIRDDLNIASGTRHEICCAVHAEQNAIIQGDPIGMMGADMYVTVAPCIICTKMIINAGIRRVYFRGDYGGYREKNMTLDFFKEAGVELKKMEE